MPTLPEEVTRILSEARTLALAVGKLTGFCIGNTRKVNESGLFFTPVRETSRLVVSGAIVYSDEQAAALARAVDGRVDYVLVDAEKKISPKYLEGDCYISNVERVVRETIKQSKIVTYKGNDITVDAIESFIAQILAENPRGLGGKKAAIIGVGNVGSKLALKLVERGMSVNLFRRDSHQLAIIVAAINIIKSAETIATASAAPDALTAARGAHLLIGLTQGTAVITEQMVDVLASGAVLIDGGKGCFHPSAIEHAISLKVPIYRADVMPAFWGQVETLMSTERLVKIDMGRAVFDGVSVVSGGLMASVGEIVVDSIFNPRTVYGVADGKGDFIFSLTPTQTKSLMIVIEYIRSRK